MDPADEWRPPDVRFWRAPWKGGAFVRRPDPTHGKRQIMFITPAGRRLFGRINPAAQRGQAELLARLTQVERIALYSALEKLRSVKTPAPKERRRGVSRRETPLLRRRRGFKRPRSG